MPWSGDVLIGPLGPRLDLRLHPRSAPQPVSVSGGDVTDRGARLEIPAAAYSGATEVSLTWLPGSAAASSTRSLQFLDDAFTSHRVLGVVHIEAAEPAAPVSLSLPVSAGATEPRIALAHRTQDGAREWLAPRSVTRGVAEFELTHFADYDLVEEGGAQIDLYAYDVGPGVMAYIDGDLRPISEHAPVPGDGTSFAVAPGERLGFVDGNGTEYDYENTSDELETFTTRPSVLAGISVWFQNADFTQPPNGTWVDYSDARQIYRDQTNTIGPLGTF